MNLICLFLLINCTNCLLGDFIHEYNNNLHIVLMPNNAEIYISGSVIAKDIVESSRVRKFDVFCSDTAIVLADNENEYEFIIIDDYILESKNKIENLVCPGDHFYCVKKFDSEGNLRSKGYWENGLKEGNWIFINDKGEMTGIKYHNGMIIDSVEVSINDEIEF